MNSQKYIEAATQELSNISASAMEEEINRIKECISISISLGFKVIQVHAAHGYFFSRLLNRTINRRTDKFAFNDYYWVSSIASHIEQFSRDILFDLRINIVDGIEDTSTEFEYKLDVISKIIKNGPRKISLTNGFYDLNKMLIYPMDRRFAYANLAHAVQIAQKFPEISFSIAGNILSALSSKPCLPSNLTVALGRPLIADPYAVQTYQVSNKICCDFCQQCHYFTLGKISLDCPLAVESGMFY